MTKTRSTDIYAGIWKLKSPGGKEFKARLQWKRFYGTNDERFGLFKILPIGKSKRTKESAVSR